MAIMIEQKTIQNNGSNKSEESSFIRAVEKIIKAGKVVCIKNFEMVLPSFSEMKLYFFIKNPNPIIDKVSIKTLLV
jgi:hypothetical protein